MREHSFSLNDVWSQPISVRVLNGIALSIHKLPPFHPAILSAPPNLGGSHVSRDVGQKQVQKLVMSDMYPGEAWAWAQPGGRARTSDSEGSKYFKRCYLCLFVSFNFIEV